MVMSTTEIEGNGPHHLSDKLKLYNGKNWIYETHSHKMIKNNSYVYLYLIEVMQENLIMGKSPKVIDFVLFSINF